MKLLFSLVLSFSILYSQAGAGIYELEGITFGGSFSKDYEVVEYQSYYSYSSNLYASYLLPGEKIELFGGLG